MNEPLVGSRENNYRFFYGASISAVSSLFILFFITGYTATDVSKLTSEMNEVMDDVRVVLPDVQDALGILRLMCYHENFTKSYGNICS